jgi:phage protein U
VIYPHYMGGFGQLKDMRAEAAKGKTHGVVSGFGR